MCLGRLTTNTPSSSILPTLVYYGCLFLPLIDALDGQVLMNDELVEGKGSK